MGSFFNGGLDASTLQGADWASPIDIGTTTPGNATFDNLTANNTISGSVTGTAGDLSAVLDPDRGGTGLGSPTANRILKTNGASAMSLLVPGALDTVIKSNGAGDWVVGTLGSGGVDWANPGSIGSGAPNTGAFTTLSANSLSLTTPLSIANGGTGQTSQVAAFNSLSPSLIAGDLIVRNATDDVRLPIGSVNGQVLTIDLAQPTKMKWAAINAPNFTVIRVTANLNFPSIPGRDFSDLSTTVTGAQLNDSVTVTPSNGAMIDGLSYVAWVSGVDTVSVRATNITSMAKDPPSADFYIEVRQY